MAANKIKKRKNGFWEHELRTAKRRAKEYGFKLWKVARIQSPKRNPRVRGTLYYGASKLSAGMKKDTAYGSLRVQELKV